MSTVWVRLNLWYVHDLDNSFGNIWLPIRKYFLETIIIMSFYRSQNILGWFKFFCVWPKIDLHIVPVPNILWHTKIWFPYSKFSFCATTKCFGMAQNAIQFLVGPKKYGPEQNSLGHVEGQGICLLTKCVLLRREHTSPNWNSLSSNGFVVNTPW